MWFYRSSRSCWRAIWPAGFRLLDDASSEALQPVSSTTGAIPALFFVSLASAETGDAVNWPFVAAFGGGLVVTFALSIAVALFVFPNRLGALGLHGMTAIFSNTGYMGIPLLITAFGDAGKLPAILATMMTGVIVLPAGRRADRARPRARRGTDGHRAQGVACGGAQSTGFVGRGRACHVGDRLAASDADRDVLQHHGRRGRSLRAFRHRAVSGRPASPVPGSERSAGSLS